MERCSETLIIILGLAGLPSCFNGAINWTSPPAVSSAFVQTQTSSPCGSPANSSVSPVYPTNGANWNDYIHVTTVLSALFPSYSQPDIACLGGELLLSSCIHGGELKTFAVPGVNNCSGLTLNEQLGVFNWGCRQNGTSVAFFTQGFKSGMGLRNLLGPNSFLPNAVSVTMNGCTVAQSAPAVWWGNTVQPAPSNPGSSDTPKQLSGAGNIFTISGSGSVASNGYNIIADHVALVTLGQNQMLYPGTGAANVDADGTLDIASGTKSSMIFGKGRKFLWLEVATNRNLTSSGPLGSAIFFYASNFLRVHGSALANVNSNGGSALDLENGTTSMVDNSAMAYNPGASGVYFYKMSYSVISGVRSSSNGSGIQLNDSNYISLLNTITANNTLHGILLTNDATGSTSNNQLVNITSFNNSEGIYLQGGGPYVTGNTVLHTSVFQNNYGVFLSNSNTFSNDLLGVLAAGNNSGGVSVGSSSSNFFRDVFAWNNNSYGIGLSGAYSTQFSGLFESINNSNANNCSVAGGANNQLNSTCNYGIGALAPSNLDLSQAISGNVTSPDPANRSLSNPNGTNVSDFAEFSSFFRDWGAQATAAIFPSANSFGTCAAGAICQIYDARPAFNSNLKSYFGNFVPNQVCPPSVDPTIAGNVYMDQGGNRFLVNATEIPGDSQGNGNGLCESGEICLFAPNLGGYQGEGNVYTSPCLFNGGNGINNVTMLGFMQTSAP